MTLPETNPPPLATPVIGYAGADAIQLDLRALARIRLGTGFLIAGLAGPLVRFVSPFSTYTAQVAIAAGFTLCFAAAACLLAANTGLHSDRPVFRRLLVAAAIALVVATAAYILTTYLIFGGGRTPNPSRIWILNLVVPFNTVAYATTVCLNFVRLAALARQFRAGSIAVQCVLAAGLLLALQAVYLSFGFVARLTGIGSLQSLSLFLSLLRPALSLWAIVFLTCLLPRLKPAHS